MRSLPKIAFIRSITAFILFLLMGWSVSAQNAPLCSAVFLAPTTSSSQNTSGQKVSFEKVSLILVETIESTGNYTSRHTVNSAEALEIGVQWLGDKYTQLGKSDSGVFLSTDKKRRFRIDKGSIMGAHSPFKPHIHLELLHPITAEMISNNHILIVD